MFGPSTCSRTGEVIRRIRGAEVRDARAAAEALDRVAAWAGVEGLAVAAVVVGLLVGACAAALGVRALVAARHAVLSRDVLARARLARVAQELAEAVGALVVVVVARLAVGHE